MPYKRVTFDEYVKMSAKEIRARTGIHPKNPFPNDLEFSQTWEVANREVLRLAKVAAQEAISEDNTIYGGNTHVNYNRQRCVHLHSTG
jgi:hypothetical protein